MDYLRVLREWSQRLWGALHPGRCDSDLEEELRLHLELAADEARRRGVGEDAMRTARIKVGSDAQAMDLLRDQRGLRWLEDLARDVRHGLRTLRRAPVFASAAILTLALGIGANTAIFSIVNGVLLRPLRYSRPAELMYLTTQFPALGFRQFPASVAEYLEFQQFNRSLGDVGAFRTGEANLMAGDRALRIRSATVDAHLLNTLDVRPAQGRLFTSQETGLVSPPPVAVISYELWQSVFGARPMVGHSVDVDGGRLRIVGVMARGADLMDDHTQIWLPLGFTDSERRERNNHNLYLIGRLKEGITGASAQSELNALTETWGAHAGITPGLGHAGHVFLPLTKGRDGHTFQMTPLADQVLGGAGRSIWMLQAAVGLVLLVACANVVNLLLARAETRHREFAVLTALGASRGRLLRKAMTESVILSVAGGALGVLLARAVLEALVRAYPASLPRIGEVGVDLRVMLVSLAAATGCGLLFGLAPMMHTRSNATAETLKSGSRGSTGTIRHRVRRALVIAETALAVIVVAGAVLLLRTVHNLTAVDAGFERSRLMTFSISLPETTYDLLGRVRAYQRLTEQLRDVPGVRMATAMTGLPLESPLSSFQTDIANNTATSGPPIPAINSYQRVMSGYFETMGIPILQGQGFQSADAASRGTVAVVNETLANRYWKGRNPIGQRLRPFNGDNGSPWFTVIGVAKDVKQSGVDQPAGTEVYLLVDQLATDSPATWVAIPPTTMHVVMRTALPRAALAPTIERVVRDVDPSVPVARLREMDEVFVESIERPRLLAQLLAAFSALALLLGAIGTYGVLAYMVAERRREIGIRMALGAGRPRVLRDVAKEGLQLTVAGTVVGMGSGVLLNRLIASLLFGVGPTDATTFATVIPAIALIAGVACSLPAWRASRLDPNVVLRSE
jgi:putative ABC transport system permease protein